MNSRLRKEVFSCTLVLQKIGDDKVTFRVDGLTVGTWEREKGVLMTDEMKAIFPPRRLIRLCHYMTDSHPGEG